MNVAYALSSDGLGHATRAQAICYYLNKKYSIRVYCEKKVLRVLKDFNSHFEMPLLQTIRRKGKVLFLKTAVHFLKYRFSYDLISRIKNDFIEHNIRLLINDFEPLSAIAAYQLGIPIVYFNNHEAVSRTNELSFYEKNIFLLANTCCIPKPGNHIITSFFCGDVGPVVRREISIAKPKKKDYFLVYNKQVINDNILCYLNDLPNENFVVPTIGCDDFTKLLINCKGYIGPAGHSLLSELIVLNKPALLFPEKNQVEQKLNAIMLYNAGRAMIGDFNNPKKSIVLFSKQILSYPWKIRSDHDFKLFDDTKSAVSMIEKSINLLNTTVPSR